MVDKEKKNEGMHPNAAPPDYLERADERSMAYPYLDQTVQSSRINQSHSPYPILSPTESGQRHNRTNEIPCPEPIPQVTQFGGGLYQQPYTHTGQVPSYPQPNGIYTGQVPSYPQPNGIYTGPVPAYGSTYSDKPKDYNGYPQPGNIPAEINHTITIDDSQYNTQRIKVGNVIVTQPCTVYANTIPTSLSSQPLYCVTCQRVVNSTVYYDIGVMTWLYSIGCIFVGCVLGCCLIPFCVDSCKDAHHRCPNCTTSLGKVSRC